MKSAQTRFLYSRKKLNIYKRFCFISVLFSCLWTFSTLTERFLFSSVTEEWKNCECLLKLFKWINKDVKHEFLTANMRFSRLQSEFPDFLTVILMTLMNSQDSMKLVKTDKVASLKIREIFIKPPWKEINTDPIIYETLKVALLLYKGNTDWDPFSIKSLSWGPPQQSGLTERGPWNIFWSLT